MSTAPVTVKFTLEVQRFRVEARRGAAAVAMLGATVGIYVDDPDGARRNAALTDARDRLAMACDAAEGIA